MAAPPIRIQHPDPRWIHHFLAKYESKFRQAYEEVYATQDEVRRTQFALVHANLSTLCFFLYASGRPASDVRQCIDMTVHTYRDVLRLRGSESTGMVDLQLPEDLSEPFDLGKALERAAIQTSDERDFSLGNSHTTLCTIYLALAKGDVRAAKELARGVWDPDDATYIGVDSEVCTPSQQHLAYALRDCLTKDHDKADSEFRKIAAPTIDVSMQAAMVGALVNRDASRFVEKLEGLLTWHEEHARHGDNLYDPTYFFCLPATGLTSLALGMGVISEDRVPGGNAYLPRDVILGEVL